MLGTSETTFEPNSNITREQMMSMLYRYEQSKGGGFVGTFAFSLDFPDAESGRGKPCFT